MACERIERSRPSCDEGRSFGVCVGEVDGEALKRANVGKAFGFQGLELSGLLLAAAVGVESVSSVSAKLRCRGKSAEVEEETGASSYDRAQFERG